MTEVEKLHGLHNTGMTMHERFTLLAKHPIGRRGNGFSLRGRTPRARGRERTNPALLEAIVQQLNQAQMPFQDIPFRSSSRSRSKGLRRYGSEGSLHSAPGFRKVRSNSFGPNNQINKNQKWRRSNGNLSNYVGSVNGSVFSAHSTSSHGYWLRGNPGQNQVRGEARGRGRGRGFRGRVNRGRVVALETRPARGSGRRGARRNARGDTRLAPAAAVGESQASKQVPTKEELDAQLDQYMSSTKAALDKELDEYMRNAMDFD